MKKKSGPISRPKEARMRRTPHMRGKNLNSHQRRKTVAVSAEEGAVSAEEVARLVAEAEQRGYLRGLNENAGEMMRRPALLENPRVRTAPEKDRDTCQTFASRFLTRLPRGVWD